MKIVGGKFGGRKLSVPKNRDVRPTSDKIRGAVFNMLSSRGALENSRVLDAFCGTGALGLEALSRGAMHVTFMDKAHISLDLAKENAAMLKTDDVCDFILKDSSKIGKCPDKPYDLIFLDPPYNKGLINTALEALIKGDWLAPDCWIICESERSFQYSGVNINTDNEKIYGNAKITLLTNNA